MEIECILTGKSVIAKHYDKTIGYDLEIAGNTVEIFICKTCQTKITSTHPHHIINSLIANNKWPERSFITHSTCNQVDITESEMVVLPDYLNTLNYPRTPSDKLNSLFLYLFGLQKFDGEEIVISLQEDIHWIKNYFKNKDELNFYKSGLVENNLIEFQTAHKFKITHKGLSKAVELLEDGNKSINCFVAMSFDDSMKPYREAIKKALITTGYIPIIIDEEHLNSDKTIPDGILSGIKRSKFCVADFTMHRNGVYFESGYALGLGKPVIYLCRKDEFEKAHFDIKQLQHIIYSSDEELEKKLVEKIEVWIK